MRSSHWKADELGGKRNQTLTVASSESVFEEDVDALDQPSSLSLLDDLVSPKQH